MKYGSKWELEDPSHRTDTDKLGIPQGGVLSVTLFLVVINHLLGEFGNGVNGSLFADDLTIYIKQETRVALSDQQAECMGSRKAHEIFP